ncbi:MAG: type II toxin-antitoxin system RelE/ParE family toxin [Microbacterium sp.]
MSARRVVTTTRADEDIDGAVEFLVGSGARDSATEFVDALRFARNLISNYPHIGSTRLAIELRLPELRTLALREVPYLLCYTNDADAVRIHRVLHSRRDIMTDLQELI